MGWSLPCSTVRRLATKCDKTSRGGLRGLRRWASFISIIFIISIFSIIMFEFTTSNLHGEHEAFCESRVDQNTHQHHLKLQCSELKHSMWDYPLVSLSVKKNVMTFSNRRISTNLFLIFISIIILLASQAVVVSALGLAWYWILIKSQVPILWQKVSGDHIHYSSEPKNNKTCW